MKYMLLMYTNPVETLQMSRETIHEIEQKHKTLLEELNASGEIVNGAGLNLPGNTKTVHFGSDEITEFMPIADETRQVTAYYVVECETEDRALEIARSLLDYHVTDVEVRGIHSTNGM